MTNQEKRGIVHVSSHHPQTGGADGGGYLSGRELERVERVQRQWMAKGYGVAPVPADGREHPEDVRCPACSAGEQETVTIDWEETVARSAQFTRAQLADVWPVYAPADVELGSRLAGILADAGVDMDSDVGTVRVTVTAIDEDEDGVAATPGGWMSCGTENPGDQQRDLDSPYWAQIGPEDGQRWSWTILDGSRENAEIGGGRADGEAGAKSAVDRWWGKLHYHHRDGAPGHRTAPACFCETPNRLRRPATP
jgi:hypothetical protein